MLPKILFQGDNWSGDRCPALWRCTWKPPCVGAGGRKNKKNAYSFEHRLQPQSIQWHRASMDDFHSAKVTAKYGTKHYSKTRPRWDHCSAPQNRSFKMARWSSVLCRHASLCFENRACFLKTHGLYISHIDLQLLPGCFCVHPTTSTSWRST